MCEIATSIDKSLTLVRFEFNENRAVYIRYSETFEPKGFPIGAEDVVQDAHLAIEKDVQSGKCSFDYGCSGRLANYIRQRIRWMWLTHRRKLKTSYQPNRSLSDVEYEFASALKSPDRAAESAELRIAVHDCMSSLSENMRKLIAMKFSEDLSHAEIGERLGIEKYLVAGRAATALKQLRKCLESKQTR